MHKIRFAFAFVALLVLCGCGNLNRFESLEKEDGGFGMFRSGQPTEKEIEALCEKGVKRIFALNGMAGEYLEKLAAKCPSARVVYNQPQDPDVGLEKKFIEEFDRQIVEAKAANEGVLIHCYCGCHRTGRLSAYYRMKYQGWTADQAITEMLDVGKNMGNHPSLPAQVRAMEDYIHGRPCGQAAELCLR